MINIALTIIIGLILISAIRVLKGPTIWDRLLGFNLISSKIIMGIVLYALIIDRSYILDIALIYSVFGFMSIVLIARFIKGGS